VNAASIFAMVFTPRRRVLALPKASVGDFLSQQAFQVEKPRNGISGAFSMSCRNNITDTAMKPRIERLYLDDKKSEINIYPTFWEQVYGGILQSDWWVSEGPGPIRKHEETNCCSCCKEKGSNESRGREREPDDSGREK
jgi:hypothetical protein